VRAGRVRVNGRPAQVGDRADPSRDVVTVDGERVQPRAFAAWLVHKPRGVVTTARDPEGRPTVLDLVPKGGPRVFPVGRLDRETEGLVLLTNDGELANRLLHPRHEVEREYRVTARGRLDERAQRRLAAGVHLADGRTAPARLERVRYDESRDVTAFALVIHEGRKRQIRRALAALGHPVRRLVRVRMGPLRLGRLPRGAARPLRAEERRALAALREGAGGAQGSGASAGRGGRSRSKRSRGRLPSS